MIQKDQVIFLLMAQFHGTRTRAAKIHLNAGTLQEELNDRKIRLIIIDSQDPCILCRKALRFRDILMTGSVLHEITSQRFLIDIVDRELHPEFRTGPIFALNSNRSLHGVHNALYDCKSQPGTLNIDIGLDIRSGKRLKKMGLVLFSDSPSGILHKQIQFISVLRETSAELERYRTLFRILHCVIDQIDQDLSDPEFVTDQFVRNFVYNLRFKLQLLFIRSLPDKRDHVEQHIGH